MTTVISDAIVYFTVIESLQAIVCSGDGRVQKVMMESLIGELTALRDTDKISLIM